MSTRLAAGCMTGTSLDAIDAALIRVEGEGLGMRVAFERTASVPLGSLGKRLRPITQQRRRPIGDIARCAAMIGECHTQTLKTLIGDDIVDFVAVHGQTVFHEANVTCQLINPHPIVAALGVPVAYDFRGADVAHGGGGAPITPLADHVFYRDAAETRAVVNLGGFANFTWLPPARETGDTALASIRGGDICVCNQLLDFIARRCFKKAYDKGGRRARKGAVHPHAEESLAPLLDRQARDSRSLGTGDEATDWARSFQQQCTGNDLAATACHVIGRVVAHAVTDADRVILAGGGALNQTLVDALRASTQAEVVGSDGLGVPAQYREAGAMAVLAALAQDGVGITLPQVTGRNPDCVPKPAWVHP